MSHYSLFKSVTNDLEFLLKEASELVLINGIKTQALITSYKPRNNGLDTRKITTDFQIKQGDIITWREKAWVVSNEIATSTGHLYKSVVQHMPHVVDINLGAEKKHIGEDSLGRPIYSENIVSIKEHCIVSDLSYSMEGMQLKAPVSELKITLRDYIETRRVKIGNTFNFGLYTYKVEHIDFSRIGLTILYCKR